eukprot:TRINITY_DN6675_c0_g1_i15.p2 TRINITY_DN6675_c0_g1~~TRINITY_DN6675_c0_g1_i15.p2  ORF type:complete len:190 (+),score=-14.13 TRINITY_DN6675_c0_g1_i15:621-1190(+)
MYLKIFVVFVVMFILYSTFENGICMLRIYVSVFQLVLFFYITAQFWQVCVVQNLRTSSKVRKTFYLTDHHHILFTIFQYQFERDGLINSYCVIKAYFVINYLNSQIYLSFFNSYIRLKIEFEPAQVQLLVQNNIPIEQWRKFFTLDLQQLGPFLSLNQLLSLFEPLKFVSNNLQCFFIKSLYGQHIHFF